MYCNENRYYSPPASPLRLKGPRSSPARIHQWQPLVSHLSDNLSTPSYGMEPTTPGSRSCEESSMLNVEDQVKKSLLQTATVEGLTKGPKTCAQCGSSKTPLWRNGPPGPKSLCNACGIRYNKLKAGKRSRSISADDAALAPPSPAPSTPGFKCKARSIATNHKRDLNTQKEPHLFNVSSFRKGASDRMTSVVPPRKRNRYLDPMYSYGEMILNHHAAVERLDTSNEEGMHTVPQVTSSGSNSGGSCISRKARRIHSPMLESVADDDSSDGINTFSLDEKSKSRRGSALPADLNEGARLLMTLFYGVGSSWMPSAVAV